MLRYYLFWVRRNRPSLTVHFQVLPNYKGMSDVCWTEFFKDCRDRCWYDGQQVSLPRLPMPACRYCSWICRPELAENNPAEQAIQRWLKSEPPQFMHPSIADKITTGDMEDDFDQLAECDLIIEAVIERLPVKQALYKRLYQVIGLIVW